MSFAAVWWTCVLLFAGLHFVVVPRLRKQIAKDQTPGVIEPFAKYHLWAMLRTAMLALTVGAALLWLVMWAVTVGGQGSVSRVNVALSILRRMQSGAQMIHIGLLLLTFCGLAGGLAWLSYKQARQKASALFAAIDAEERTRVVESYKKNEWVQWPPTEPMQRLGVLFQNEARKLEQAAARSDAAEIERLKKVLDDLRSLYFRMDAERRMNLTARSPLSDDLVLPASATWSDRLRDALLNRGVLQSMRGGSRLVALSGLALMVPAAASLQMGVAQPDFTERMVELQDLKIDLARKDAENQIQLALQQGPPPPAAEPRDDDEVAEVLAQQFDSGMHSLVLARALPAKLRPSLVHEALREQILAQYARHGAEAQVAAWPEVHEAHPMTAPRRTLQQRLRQMRTENRALWQRLKAAVPGRSDFMTPLTRSELVQGLATEVRRAAFVGAASEFATAYDTHATYYIAELAKGQPLEKARTAAFAEESGPLWTQQTDESLHALQQVTDVEGHPVDRGLRERPPTLHGSGPTAQQAQAAERILKDMPLRSRQTAALNTFQDILPGRLGDEARTTAAEIGRRVEPGRTSPSGLESARAFSRSYSFAALRGYSQVGGVLIGRPPESGGDGRPDIVAIDWDWVDGDKLGLTLTTRAGTKHRFGPYPGHQMLHALTYAADRRPLAVSMISADPIPDLKVLVHPALLNNATGCRVVALDRVADEATQRASYRLQAERRVYAQNALYRMAWAVLVSRWITWETGLDGSETQVILEYARKVREVARRELTTELTELRRSLAAGEPSLIAAKSEFFDPTISEAGATCAAKGQTIEAIEQCLQQSKSSGSARRALTLLPEFQIWSGVRERPYPVDAGLNFLRRSSSTDWPFDFVVQVAFSHQGPAGAEARDGEPWTLGTIQESLNRDIRNHVESQGRQAAIVSEVADFALLQRLFRAAFAGHLGAAFPMDRLAILSAQLNAKRAAADGYRTPQWNTRNLETYYANVLTQFGRTLGSVHPRTSSLVQQAPGAIAACGQSAASTAAISGALTPASCKLESLKKDAQWVQDYTQLPMSEREYAEEVRRMINVLEIRRVMEVRRPENTRQAACPAY